VNSQKRGRRRRRRRKSSSSRRRNMKVKKSYLLSQRDLGTICTEAMCNDSILYRLAIIQKSQTIRQTNEQTVQQQKQETQKQKPQPNFMPRAGTAVGSGVRV
jgi:hypothetical protein